MRKWDLSGEWTIELSNGFKGTGTFPGTLDSNGIGEKEEPLATRLTRVVTFVGEAKFSRDVEIHPEAGKRAILKVERGKQLRLRVNGEKISCIHPANISTPYTWDITNALSDDGINHIEIISDNSYPGWPADDIIYSSASTDETQINYNGLLGELSVTEVGEAYFSSVRVLPELENEKLQVLVEIESELTGMFRLNFESSCLTKPAWILVFLHFGRNRITLPCEVQDGLTLWDEWEGNLYTGCVTLLDPTLTPEKTETTVLDSKAVRFGLRAFEAIEDRLELNGHPIFLRSEANCGLFPETGYEPMDVESWRQVLLTYKCYGINHVRFHSHTPPEAAFFAADELGILMSPELSCWNPRHAFESLEAIEYYKNELIEIVRTLGSHPSFVSVTLGNELQCDDSLIFTMGDFLAAAREVDDCRLYAIGSNCWYGAKGPDEYSDFYTASGCGKADLRGTYAAEEGEHVQGRVGNNLGGCINNMYPNNTHTLEEGISAVHEKRRLPVFGFEVGQFEVLPDFAQIEEYKGATRAENIRMVKDRKDSLGISDEEYREMVEATGELALIGYRNEIELAMKTKGMSGISLLGLQDFTGQGTALVGMLDAHLKPKPYAFARPDRFAAFFKPVLPILLLDRYTYAKGETLKADVLLCNFSREEVENVWLGERKVIDEITMNFSDVHRNSKVDINLNYGGHTNTYSVWVYDVPERVEAPKDIYVTEKLDAKAQKVLSEGGKVFLSPSDANTAFKNVLACHFTTDFWSKGTFPAQDGEMGQLIDTSHPVFRNFPTEKHTNYQWWPMATAYAVEVPRRIKPIVAELDSYDRLRHMAQLFEVKVGAGKLLVSTMELTKTEKQKYPEVRALLSEIYSYMAGDEFDPKTDIDLSELALLDI